MESFSYLVEIRRCSFIHEFTRSTMFLSLYFTASNPLCPFSFFLNFTTLLIPRTLHASRFLAELYPASAHTTNARFLGRSPRMFSMRTQSSICSNKVVSLVFPEVTATPSTTPFPHTIRWILEPQPLGPCPRSWFAGSGRLFF